MSNSNACSIICLVVCCSIILAGYITGFVYCVNFNHEFTDATDKMNGGVPPTKMTFNGVEYDVRFDYDNYRPAKVNKVIININNTKSSTYDGYPRVDKTNNGCVVSFSNITTHLGTISDTLNPSFFMPALIEQCQEKSSKTDLSVIANGINYDFSSHRKITNIKRIVTLVFMIIGSIVLGIVGIVIIIFGMICICK